MKRNYMVAAALIAGALLLAPPVTAAAASLIDSSDIKNQSVLSVDLAEGSVGSSEVRTNAVGTTEVAYSSLTGFDIANDNLTGVDVKDGSLGIKEFSAAAKADLQGSDGTDGSDGADGTDGTDGVDGADGVDGENGVGFDDAVYRIANYVNGGGGYATVACADDQTESQKYVAISGGVYQARLDENGNFIDDANYPAIAQSFPGRMDWTTNTPKADRLDGWVVKFNGGNATTLKVYAVCVPLDFEVQTTNY